MATFYRYMSSAESFPPFELWEQDFLRHLLTLPLVQNEILRFMRQYPVGFYLGVCECKLRPGRLAISIVQSTETNTRRISPSRVSGVLAGRLLVVYLNSVPIAPKELVYAEGIKGSSSLDYKW